MSEASKETKRRPGRPVEGQTKKSLSICVRTEPFVKEYVFEKFGGWQKFFDHYAYKLCPKEMRPKKVK